MALHRVRKAEAILQATWHQPDGLDVCLACWQDYMRCDDRDLGFQPSNLYQHGGEEEASDVEADVERDPYNEQRLADLDIGEATDAMIDSLPRIHIWAIYKSCGIGQAWSFPHADFLATLADARVALTEKLKKNVRTRVKF